MSTAPAPERAAILDELSFDERFTLLTSPPSPEVDQAFDAARTFGDPRSIADLRLALAAAVRDREHQHAVEILRSFADDKGDRGVRARRALHELEGPCLPEPAHLFVRSFARLAATALLDSRSRAGRRRGELLTAVIDEAAVDEVRAA